MLARNGAYAAMIAGSLTAGSAGAATLDHAPYGTTQDGRAVEIYTLTNDHGMRVRFLSYGAGGSTTSCSGSATFMSMKH